MSSDALRQLIGLNLVRLEKVHDYLQLEFSNGAILSIYNKYQPAMDSLSLIQRTQLLAVDELGDKIAFKFSKGGVLSVGMGDADYNLSLIHI